MTCSIGSCRKKVFARGWCRAHWNEWRRAQPDAVACSIEGCGAEEFAGGWCQKHWTRWRRHGDPLASLRRMDMTVMERFFDQVEITNGCWLWTAPLSRGYGTFEGEPAHRWSYITFIGPVPEGLQVDHTCHNLDLSCRGFGESCPHRRCVNPDHLEAVTQAENIRRVYADRTHCSHGHELTPENTRVRFHRGHKKWMRDCRTCAREQNRRARQKQVAA